MARRGAAMVVGACLLVLPPLWVHHRVGRADRVEAEVWGLLVAGETVSADSWDWPAAELDALLDPGAVVGLDPSAWAAFRDVATERVAIPADLAAGTPYTLLPRDAEADCFAAAEAGPLPCRFVELSRVGVSTDGRQAVLLRGRFGPEGGDTRLLWLTRDGDAWTVREELAGDLDEK